MLFESALSYVIDIFEDEAVKAVTEEQKKAIFSVCLQTGYGKSLIYQVAPAKTGLISRGEHHSFSWQFCTCATENVSNLGRGLLLLRFHK